MSQKYSLTVYILPFCQLLSQSSMVDAVDAHIPLTVSQLESIDT